MANKGVGDSRPNYVDTDVTVSLSLYRMAMYSYVDYALRQYVD